MIPFKDYAVLALIALAAYITWDWQDEMKSRAAEKATYTASMQIARENLEASHESIRTLTAERKSAERAVAVANKARDQAQARYDASADTIAQLERRSPAARTFLDCRMPDELYRCLRDDAACADENRDQGDPAASRISGAEGGARVIGPGRARRGGGLDEDQARTGEMQRPRRGPRAVDGRAPRGGA